MLKWMCRTRATGWVILIRLMVGCVFLSEGIQKFLFPHEVGSGRFERIGIPWPEFSAGFIGVFEILCGGLVLIGLLTRGAVLPLVVIMCVAIVSTKVPIFMDEGFWRAVHESRTDWSMLLGSLFLLAVGGGRFSVDGAFIKKV